MSLYPVIVLTDFKALSLQEKKNKENPKAKNVCLSYFEFIKNNVQLNQEFWEEDPEDLRESLTPSGIIFGLQATQ